MIIQHFLETGVSCFEHTEKQRLLDFLAGLITVRVLGRSVYQDPLYHFPGISKESI
jgi:hypothetical protein